MNKVILLGHVVRDPKIRIVDSSTVAEFNLATTEKRRGRAADGSPVDMPEITEWHNIVMWGRAAEFCRKIHTQRHTPARGRQNPHPLLGGNAQRHKAHRHRNLRRQLRAPPK